MALPSVDFGPSLGCVVLRRVVLGCVVLGCVVLGCAVGCGHKGSEPSAPPPAQAQVISTPGVSWVYYPERSEALLRSVAVGEGTLSLDTDGARFVQPGPEQELKFSEFGEPEPLSSWSQLSDGFAFVGQSGRVYRSGSPLGALVADRAAPVAFVEASAQGEVIIGRDRLGRVYRSQNMGRSWKALPLDGYVGGVGLDASGEALAFTLPEHWYLLPAGSESFDALSTPPIGPRRFRFGADAGLIIDGHLGSYRLGASSFKRISTAPSTESRGHRVRRGPSGLALTSGRAALWRSGSGELQYIEFKRRAKSWVKYEGRAFGLLEEGPFDALSSCDRVRLAVSAAPTDEATLHVLCRPHRARGSSPELRLLSGAAHRGELSEHEGTLRGDFEQVRLSAAGGGALVLSGLCRAEETAPGCVSQGLQVLAPGAEQARSLELPGFDQVIDLSVDSGAVDGRLLVLGQRDKDGHILLASLAPPFRALSQLIDLTQSLGLPLQGQADKEVKGRIATSSGDGTSVFVSRGSAMSWAPLDEALQPLPAAPLRAQLTALDGAGLRLLGVDAEGQRQWESLDGGLSWAAAELPRKICAGEQDECEPALRCFQEGCIVGERLTRRGWGLEAATETPTSRDSASAVELAPPIVCKPTGSDWFSLSGVHQQPRIDDAGFSSADWSLTEVDKATASVRVVLAKQGRVERHVLLEPSTTPNLALAVRSQYEGVAALRYVLPDRALGETKIRSVEVAWDNRITDERRVAKLPGVYSLWPGDVSRESKGKEPDPGLLSIAGRGLFLQLHQRASSDFFWFEGGQHQKIRSPWSSELTGQRELARVSGETIALTFPADRGLLVTTPAGAQPLAHRLLPGDARSRGILSRRWLAYQGQDIGFVSYLYDLRSERSWSSFAALAADGTLGEAKPVPTMGDVRNGYHPCSREERLSSPRMVAPAVGGQSRELHLELSSERRMSFSVQGAVLHGTPEAPCAAAWETGLRRGRSSEDPDYRVLLIESAAGRHGWVFRYDRETPSERAAAVRALSCTDSSATP